MYWIVIVLLFMASSAQAQSFETTVAPLPSESFAGPCHYDLSFPAGAARVKAVWVTYDRGRDIMKFYSDPDVIAFARRHDLALMMPHQCPAKNASGGPEEMDMEPAHGVGRALFAALDQFAQQSGHPELSSAKLILLGFSGTGALFAQFVGYAPERIVASILADPGHYDPAGIDNVHLPPSGLEVPEFIMTGGADKVSGTQRPYNYFRLYRDRGAPWAFLVQNEIPHCCIINTKALMLAWLDQIIKLRHLGSAKPLRPINTQHGWEGFVRTYPSGVQDTWGAPAWNVSEATIQQVGRAGPANMIPSGWLPNHRVATEWLNLIKQPTHATTSQP